MAPQVYDPEDAQSQLSGALSSALSRSESLKVTRTETTKSLQTKGLTGQISHLDVNRPQTVANPIFPEEYTMETETGLVPVQTLHELGRSKTRTSEVLPSITQTLSRRDGSIQFSYR
ncbi:unnamed protein product [[Candida] boidinii]|nr:unnamed protein product [[Candida] boidinii]